MDRGLAVPIVQLIGFRDRLVVRTNWAWDYFFYERAIRLITEPKAVPAVPTRTRPS